MGNGPGKRVKNNLVALGSAAVLTVYSAGYFRTRSAAQRFEGEDAGRRPAASTPGLAPTTAAAPLARPAETPPSTSRPRTQTSAANRAGEVGAPPKTPQPAGPVSTASSTQASSAPAASGSSARAAAAASSATAPASAAPSASVAASTATPAESAPQSSTPAAPRPALDSSTAAQPADSAADKLRKKYKDGLYSGWGTSRHGDIQAEVQIEDGRIIAAYITRCLTRYSCSWISHLPPQVVTRQSPDVDYVSGATQSTNAFYYAVLEALAKAK